MKRFGLLVLGLYLAGCATTNPLPGSDIEYRLPRTDAVLTVTLTLMDCVDFHAEGSISVAAEAGPSNAAYKIPGTSLASARIKRTFKVTKNADDVIVGVNSDVSDRSPQIVSNVVKAVAGAAVLAGNSQVAPMGCRNDIRPLVDRSAFLTTQIQSIYKDSKPTAEALKSGGEMLDQLSKQLAALKSALTISIKVPLVISDTDNDAAISTEIDLSEPLKVWFTGVSSNQIEKLYGFSWNVRKDHVIFRDDTSSKLSNKVGRDCKLSMKVPDSKRAILSVVGTGSWTSTMKAETGLYVGQWSSRDLCIDAGFGESRTNDLTFDDYGHQTSANWISEARAEAISGMVSGSIGDVSTIAGAIAPSTVKAQKTEIDKLQTQQTYNKLKACEAVIKAGGSTCP